MPGDRRSIDTGPMAWTLGMVGLLLAALVALGSLLAVLGMSWGATADERRAPLPGDGWLPQEPGRMRIAMTRAVTIAAPVDDVWPWVAQLGRGAGWYSYDAVDNGRRGSASHLVSWIPAPRLGDASAIGYIRHLEPNRSVAWWAPGERWLGADVRMVAAYQVSADGDMTRLVQRITGHGTGWSKTAVKLLFAVADALMSRRQLLGIRHRAERFGTRSEDPEHPETGRRDQFQVYGCFYADGGHAGVPGKEAGARWRERALAELGPQMGAANS